MDKLIAILRELATSKWYGRIEIVFESGKIVIVKKTESIKV